MKKIIDLGNNVNVEVEDGCFRINSANGSAIFLDSEGEFLTYTNAIGLKKFTERKEFLEKFTKIDKQKKDIIFEWFNSCTEKNNEMKQNFFFWLGEAMAEVDYDYYIAEPNGSDEMIDMMNEYQHIMPGYSLEDASKNEVILWVAYSIAKGYWTFEEGLTYNRRKNKTLYVLKK